ncbi:hypothetical protein DERF_006142 [Dermatophagoides farinae]|uniref:Uncharacterized protein n=1 Tax=Dermatophagoides farinae TaxID=6954 RepID=A0A922L7W1_DERFA|nr:hypothetical protein DERF_006142 [Dermatophagoides farinae]
MYGERYCFTFGYFGSVTYITLSKVLIAYIAIFILVANFYQKHFLIIIKKTLLLFVTNGFFGSLEQFLSIANENLKY